MRVAVVPFIARNHLRETVAVLHRVRAADPTYPPSADAEDNASSLASWLLSDDANLLSRWVAIIDNRVVGHVSIAEPHDYILKFFQSTQYAAVASDQLGEVAKFFVDPLAQRSGVGSRLLSRACEVTIAGGRSPVLAVMDTSVSARSFYAREGMEELGLFNGVHGINHVLWRNLGKP